MMNIAKAKQIARLNRTCREWREFKAKWDGRIPRKGSSEFLDYQNDARRAEAALQAIVNSVQ